MRFTQKYLLKTVSFLLFIIVFSPDSARAQERENQTPPSPFWQNVRFGGSLGLNFGTGFFTGSLSPSAIYDFNNTFSAGTGLSAAYTKQNTFSATSFGGSLIGMMRPIRQIQLSTEYEQLHITRRYEFEGANRTEQDWVPALFLGAGYNTGPVVTGVRYDVLHNRKSFYASAFMPFVRMYF